MKHFSSKDKIEALKRYFKDRPDVLFAFLFGSHAKKKAGNISDWDIAAYFGPMRHNRIEREEIGRSYPQEGRIWNDLVDILKTDNVDLVVLNRAPADIAAAAIKGAPLQIKDRKTYLEFMLITTQTAEDFCKTIQEYANVYWRSKSLSDEDKSIIIKRLIFLDSELIDALRFQSLTNDEYKKDSSKRRDVERWVENLVNVSIDISKIILASQKKTAPSTYREILQNVDFLPGFSSDLTKRLSMYAQLRNILVHEYLDIRWKRIEEFIKNAPDVLSKFSKAVREFIK